MPPKNDRFVRMYGPLLDVLREMGGEGAANEVRRKVADLVIEDGQDRTKVLSSGENAAEFEVYEARCNLVLADLIDGSVKGVWKLTPLGWATHLDLDASRKLGLAKEIRERIIEHPGSVGGISNPEEGQPAEPELVLIDLLRALPPAGFERLCQRILRTAGFADVHVTGKSGDGGIDGHGVLQVNELVSFRVLFQCKRYQGAVGSGEIRNFRGAMTGRTDKGIFLTTGSFTADARKEALRDGVPPIELVDADALTSLMERLGLGVRPRTVYDVDLDFFAPFLNP